MGRTGQFEGYGAISVKVLDRYQPVVPNNAGSVKALDRYQAVVPNNPGSVKAGNHREARVVERRAEVPRPRRAFGRPSREATRARRPDFAAKRLRSDVRGDVGAEIRTEQADPQKLQRPQIPPDAFTERDFRRPTQPFFRAGDVRVGDRHITGLRGHVPDAESRAGRVG